MNPTWRLAGAILLPAPVVLFMWLGAFAQTGIAAPMGVASLSLVVASLSLGIAAMVLSTLAIVKETAPQYDLKGNLSGAAFAALGILLYLTGTTLESGLLHAISITVFYWGAVLYLGGAKAVVSLVPSGLIIISFFSVSLSSLWGTVYLDGLSWAVVVSSVTILWLRWKTPPAKGCYLCNSFRDGGESYCSSCGRFFRIPVASLPRRRFVGFAVFVVIMLAALTLTVPVATAAPTVSLANFGLGGPRSNGGLSSLPGWEVSALPSAGSGSGASGYVLTRGGATVRAFLDVSQYPQTAFSAVNSTMNRAIPYPKVPAPLSQSMSGYNFTQGREQYIGLLGVFPIGYLNGSQVIDSFVAVGLSQDAGSFASDNGSAVYSAATSLVNWVSSWGNWYPIVEAVQGSYQTFSQVAYVCSFSVFGVVLFTVARDNELEKVRRVEAIRGIGNSEADILRAFGSTPVPLLGEDLLGSTWRINPTLSVPSFFSSLRELQRRGLVTPNLILRGGVPTLFWKCLV